MGTSHHEDSKSSSEETDDRSDQNDEAANHEMPGSGSGRSYECVFCKRGFTTAQALGGHMNIHRKDRAKNSRSPCTADQYPMVSTHVANDHINSYASLSPYRAIQGYTPHYSTVPPPPPHRHHHHEVQNEQYQTLNANPASILGMRPPPSAHLHHIHDYFYTSLRNSQQLDLSREGFNYLGIGTSFGQEDDNHNEEKVNCGRVDVELDLELRLGHHHP